MEFRYFAPGEAPEDALKVRLAVFVDEQGFSKESEFDDIDSTAHHTVLYEGTRPVACGRTFPGKEPGEWIIGRVAVLPTYRRGGTGRFLMLQLEEQCRQNGAQSILLAAQVQAQGFYEKLGYVAESETFLEEHCPHINMRKKIALAPRSGK
ncbi:GNAT family N-acetyltransferase [Oscillospiraceae bacterium MB08-C2-2]|nr:GNAT family N-acetyltransferase [Oscillospiraceae bacterium MB08-C2-2]